MLPMRQPGTQAQEAVPSQAQVVAHSSMCVRPHHAEQARPLGLCSTRLCYNVPRMTPMSSEALRAWAAPDAATRARRAATVLIRMLWFMVGLLSG